jgi:hypothetical protein
MYIAKIPKNVSVLIISIISFIKPSNSHGQNLPAYNWFTYSPQFTAVQGAQNFSGTALDTNGATINLTGTVNAGGNIFAYARNTGGVAQSYAFSNNVYPGLATAETPLLWTATSGQAGYEVPAGASSIFTLSFSTPLPEGSLLSVMDIDFAWERATVTGLDSSAYLGTVPRTTGGSYSGVFPSYDTTDATWTLTPDGVGNNGEFTFFDLSGVTSVSFSNTHVQTASSGSEIAFGVAIPVPEPSQICFLYIGSILLFSKRRRKPMGKV